MFCSDGKMKLETGLVDCKVCKGAGTTCSSDLYNVFKYIACFAMVSSNILRFCVCNYRNGTVQEVCRLWIFKAPLVHIYSGTISDYLVSIFCATISTIFNESSIAVPL